MSRCARATRETLGAVNADAAYQYDNSGHQQTRMTRDVGCCVARVFDDTGDINRTVIC